MVSRLTPASFIFSALYSGSFPTILLKLSALIPKSFGVKISKHQAIQIKLADMATKIKAAKLLTYDAALKMDLGERSDLEAGMAKLFASEVCGEVTLEAMRVLGGYGYLKDFDIERYYRDAPLMIIGEGTNEIQKLVIAKRCLLYTSPSTRDGLLYRMASSA